MDLAEQFIVCRVSFPRPQQRRVSGLGVARYAEHRYAVHRLPQPLHHKWYKAQIAFVSE
jgi:hypothetical protein